MSLNSISTLIARLRRGPSTREGFVNSHLAKGIAYQIRATRDKLGWSQGQLGHKVNMNQNAISRLESAEYGKPTITTLKRLAAAFDVGLIVRFVPFSEMVYWVSGTPRENKGLSVESLAVSAFEMEDDKGIFDVMISQSEQILDQKIYNRENATGAIKDMVVPKDPASDKRRLSLITNLHPTSQVVSHHEGPRPVSKINRLILGESTAEAKALSPYLDKGVANGRR